MKDRQLVLNKYIYYKYIAIIIVMNNKMDLIAE